MDEQLAGGSILVMAIFLATFVEFMIERAFGTVKRLKGWPMVAVSSAAGIILCIGLNVDILQMVGFEGDYISWIGQVISGLIIGSGSNAIHKFINPSTKGG